MSLEPLCEVHAHELVAAARAVASETESAARLWWAKKDYQLADAHEFIRHSVQDRDRGCGETFVVRNLDGAFIGCVSAKNIDRMHKCFQGGYWIIPSERGKGMGQASMRALHAWSLTIGMVRMELLIGVTNAVSLAVARRIGAVEEGRLRSRFMFNDTRIDVYLMAVVQQLPAKVMPDISFAQGIEASGVSEALSVA